MSVMFIENPHNKINNQENMNPIYFSQLLKPIEVVAKMNSLGSLEIASDEDSGMRKLIAFTNKEGDTRGILEPRLEDVDEDGNHLTLIDIFLNEFDVSEEDREELDKGYSVTLRMTGIQYVRWLLMRYGCIQYQQEQLTNEYVDWCHANGHGD